MYDHPLLWLALATMIIVLGVAGWSFASTKKRQEKGPNAEGVGGTHDPMA